VATTKDEAVVSGLFATEEGIVAAAGVADLDEEESEEENADSDGE